MKSILVIDDEESIRKIYTQALQKQGFNVYAVHRAVDGRNILLENPVDLVLLDLNMPDVQGDDFFEWMETFYKPVKVIVASVYPVEDQKERIRKADDYFDKSEGLESLVKHVERLVHH